MSQTKLEQYTEACNYPGRLDIAMVEKHLGRYLQALNVKRNIVRLECGWTLQKHPSIQRSIRAVLERLRIPLKNFSALDALAALDARDARDALAALDARDARDAQNFSRAIHRFASWCIQAGGWWYWRWELSWIVTTYFGSVQLAKPEVTKWAEPLLEAYLHGAWILYWTDDTLFWVAKPTVHKDTTPETRRLHNEHYAALESDVENLYFWHGVIVPAFVVVKPEWITIQHIETESNAEVRRVMIERFGQWRYLQESGAQLVNADERGSLYRKEIPNDEPLVMVKMKNSTQEPDGSFKDYFLRVPPTIQTAEQAVAWTFGYETVKDYKPLIET